MFIIFWLFNIIVSLITKENEIKILENISRVLVSFSQGFLNLRSQNHPFKCVAGMNFIASSQAFVKAIMVKCYYETISPKIPMAQFSV